MTSPIQDPIPGPIVNDRTNTRRAAAGVIALLLLLLLIPISQSVLNKDPDPPKPEAPTGSPEQCITDPYFYANDARPGSNQFGPELKDGSVEAGNARFDLKLRSDAAFAAVEEDLILYDLKKVNERGDGWYQLRAQQFLDDEGLWCDTVNKIHDAIEQSWVEDREEKYHTFLMVARGDQIPLVRRTDRPVAMGHVLAFKLKDGRTEYHRYICDLQPARPEIPGLPPISEPEPARPVAPPPPGSVPPPTSPPPTGGKDHNDSPVTDNPNDTCEACRPNTPEPERPTPPPSTRPPQPTVPTPTTVAPPAPPPSTTQPARPPGPGCQDPDGIGICEA